MYTEMGHSQKCANERRLHRQRHLANGNMATKNMKSLQTNGDLDLQSGSKIIGWKKHEVQLAISLQLKGVMKAATSIRALASVVSRAPLCTPYRAFPTRLRAEDCRLLPSTTSPRHLLQTIAAAAQEAPSMADITYL